MKNFSIKITGSGTKNQLEIALRVIARDLQDATEDELINGIEWEDPILMTEVNEE